MASSDQEYVAKVENARSKLFPVVNSIFRNCFVDFVMTYDELFKEKSIFEQLILLLQDESRKRTNVFCIEAERRIKFKDTLMYSEVGEKSLSFTEWVMKLYLLTFSKNFGDTGHNVIAVFDGVIAQLLYYISSQDRIAFVCFMEGLMNISYNLLIAMSKKESSFEIYRIREVVSKPIPLTDITIIMKSKEEMEAVYTAIRNIFKRIINVFTTYLDNSDNFQSVVNFLKETDNLCWKMRVQTFDLVMSIAEMRSLKSGLGKTFIQYLLSWSSLFLSGTQSDEMESEIEKLLISGWRLISYKISNTSSVTATFVIERIICFLNSIGSTYLNNCNNVLFQETLPLTLQQVLRICVSSCAKQIEHIVKSIVNVFEKDVFKVELKSQWIPLIKGIIIGELNQKVDNRNCFAFVSLPSSTQSASTQASSSSQYTTGSYDTAYSGSSDSHSLSHEVETGCSGQSELSVSASQRLEHVYFSRIWSKFLEFINKKSRKSCAVLYNVFSEVIIHCNTSENLEIKEFVDYCTPTMRDVTLFCCKQAKMSSGENLSIAEYSIVFNYTKMIASQEVIDKSTPLSFDLAHVFLKPLTDGEKSSNANDIFYLCLEGLSFFEDNYFNGNELKYFEDAILSCSESREHVFFELLPLYMSPSDCSSMNIVKKMIAHLRSCLPKYIGYLYCFFSDSTSRTNDWRDDYFALASRTVKCNTCTSSANKHYEVLPPTAQNENIEVKQLLEQIFLEIFNSEMKQTDRRDLADLLKFSGCSFFLHTKIDERVIKTFFTLFSLRDPLVGIVSKIMKSFCNRLTNHDCHSLVLRCFKERYTLNNEDLAKLSFTEIGVIVDFGSLLDGDLLVEVIVLLVQRCWQQEFEKAHITRLAMMKRTTTFEIFKQYRSKLCSKLMDIILNKVPSEQQFVYLLNFVSAFVMSNSEEELNKFFKEALKFVVPYLVMQRSDKIKPLLKSVSEKSCIQDSRADKLIEYYFLEIMKAFVTHLNVDEISDSLRFMRGIYTKDLKALFESNSSELKLHLLFRYHTHRERCSYLLWKLNFCENDVDEDMENVNVFNTYFMTNMRIYFTNLGFLLLKPTIAITEKTEALESLSSILENLHPDNIIHIETQLKVVLKDAFKNNDRNEVYKSNEGYLFVNSIIKNWSVFTRKHRKLGKQVVEISNTLVPLLNYNVELTSKIFTNLIVDRRNEFCDFFSELHFLPKITELNEVNDVIKDINTSSFSREDFTEKISQIIGSLQSDNQSPDVKVLHLQKLREILKNDRRSLCRLRLPQKGESSDVIIRKLLKTLIDSCMPYENLHLAIAECLGEIGAIEPGTLELSNDRIDANDKKLECFDVNSPDFGLNLLSELFTTLDSKDESRIHNCAYFAMQEVLKEYKVQMNDEFWKRLNPQLQSTCSTLLDSMYCVNDENFIVNDSLVYRVDIDYKEWIFKWTCKLTGLITSQRACKLFSSCLAIVKYNCGFAQFLLPYVLLYALRDSSDNSIHQEIEAIANSSTTDNINNFPHPITSPMESKISITTTRLIQVQHLCVQTVFSLLDALEDWLVDAISSKVKNTAEFQRFHQAVVAFLSKLDKSDLSSLAYNCQSYARSLRYMEQCKRSATGTYFWQMMQKFYVALDDPDGVEGIVAKMGSSKSLMGTILEHEVKGQYQKVLSCCEIGSKLEPLNIDYVKTHIRCLMNLDQPSFAAQYTAGCVTNNSHWKQDLVPYMIEAAWKLSDWNTLESLINKHESNRNDIFGVGIGKLFLFARNKNENEFERTLRELREKEMNPISAAAMESGAYIRAYPHLVRLHMINDLEYGLHVFLPFKDSVFELPSNMISTLEEWNTRNEIVQGLRFQEPILNLQRIMLSLGGKNVRLAEERAKLWLSSAKIARKSRHFQRAYSCLFEAEEIINSFVNESDFTLRCQILIEKGKYYWSNQDSQDEAVTLLSKGIEKLSTSVTNQDPIEKKNAFVKIKLLHTKYAEQTAKLSSNDLITLYKNTIAYDSKCEEAYFCLAKYSDRLLGTMEKPEQRAETMIRVVKTFSESLCYGAKHVYESVPRMLSVWFDFGSLCPHGDKSRRNSSSTEHVYAKSYGEMTKVIELFNRIPSYYFVTAFAQLLSRVGHPFGKLRDQLIALILRVVKDHPKQTLWMIIGSVNSTSNKARSAQCQKILTFISKSQDMTRFCSEMKKLAKLLIEVCNCKEQPGTQFLLNKTVPELKTFFKDSSQILLPYQSMMNVRLPPKATEVPRNHQSFADPIFIVDIKPKVDVLSSLVAPKKITFVCSDGKEHIVMCKPKDDLRKDGRTMDFMNLVNFHLKKDPETRKRQLAIKTYAVVPLNDECGLLEWVDNLKSLRSVMSELYNERNGSILKKALTDYRALANILDVKTRADNFTNSIIPSVSPPVFSEFFFRSFRDPTAWYMSRLCYVRSCAVMSIIGYIIGLGDRHLDNILINQTDGYLVHVDFNLIFKRGECLQVPELVPFRLTHNMIDAMGATDYEGAFRKTCEETLRVMRTQTDPLMSVLKPFVYDPILDWKDDKNKMKKNNQDSEITSEQALQNVQNIEDRLKGILKHNNKPSGLPVSVSGQVSYLIAEATNAEKLSNMYYGWSPYI